MADKEPNADKTGNGKVSGLSLRQMKAFAAYSLLGQSIYGSANGNILMYVEVALKFSTSSKKFNTNMNDAATALLMTLSGDDTVDSILMEDLVISQCREIVGRRNLLYMSEYDIHNPSASSKRSVACAIVYKTCCGIISSYSDFSELDKIIMHTTHVCSTPDGKSDLKSIKKYIADKITSAYNSDFSTAVMDLSI